MCIRDRGNETQSFELPAGVEAVDLLLSTSDHQPAATERSLVLTPDEGLILMIRN